MPKDSFELPKAELVKIWTRTQIDSWTRDDELSGDRALSDSWLLVCQGTDIAGIYCHPLCCAEALGAELNTAL